MYLPLPTLQKFVFQGRTDRVSKIQIEFNEKTNPDTFIERWRAKLQEADPLLKLRLTRDRREQLDQNLMAVHVLSYLGGTVSMLAATFIVFSTVSMGVSERQRSLAMLRAVGLLRSQLVKLVLTEAHCSACSAQLVGVPIGLIWVHMLAWKFSRTVHRRRGRELRRDRVRGRSDRSCRAPSSPASCRRSAQRESIRWKRCRRWRMPARKPRARRCADAGWIAVHPGRSGHRVSRRGERAQQCRALVRFYSHFVLGLPGLMIGFFLLAPLFVWLVDRVLSRPRRCCSTFATPCCDNSSAAASGARPELARR